MNYCNTICIATCILFLIALCYALYKLQQWKKEALVKTNQVKHLKDDLVAADAEHDADKAHLNDIIKKREAELKDFKEKSENDFNEAVEKAVEERTKDLETETTESMGEIIKNLDTQVGNQLKELISNHTLYFQCACSKNPADRIPCYIDFTKENKFQCKKCGAKYRVEISARPVLLTRTINESVLAEEIQKQINTKFGNNE